MTRDDTFVTLSVSARGVAVETRINGVLETFVSGGTHGDLAASAPINAYLEPRGNTVEFALVPSETRSSSNPEFRAILELRGKGEIVDTSSAGGRPIFTRELSAAEAAALASGRAVSITADITLEPASPRTAAAGGTASPPPTSPPTATHRSELEAEITTTLGQRGTRRQVEVVTVRGEPVEPGQDGWNQVVHRLRPDWATGRIIERDARVGGRTQMAAIFWALLTVVLSVATWEVDGFMRIIALGVGVMATALIVQAVRIQLHRWKFGESILALDRVPVRLGRDLIGEVVSGVPATMAPADGFHIRLRCVHHWQEDIRRGSDQTRRTRFRRDTLWEDEHQTAGRRDPTRRTFRIPVRFRLPADRPASTVPGGDEGIVWEVHVTARMRGLNYDARFEIPVVTAGFGSQDSGVRIQDSGSGPPNPPPESRIPKPESRLNHNNSARSCSGLLGERRAGGMSSTLRAPRSPARCSRKAARA